MHEAGAVSYYFSNFPENWDERALWNMFVKWGKVVDIYVSKKKSKTGQPFGFVRFVEVTDIGRLENVLDQIWITLFKLMVNLARFERNEKKKV